MATKVKTTDELTEAEQKVKRKSTIEKLTKQVEMSELKARLADANVKIVEAKIRKIKADIEFAKINK